MREKEREKGYSSAEVSASAPAGKTNAFDYKCTTEKSLVQAGGTARIQNEEKTLKSPQQDKQSENVNVRARQLHTVSNYLRGEKKVDRFTLKH